MFFVINDLSGIDVWVHFRAPDCTLNLEALAILDDMLGNVRSVVYFVWWKQ